MLVSGGGTTMEAIIKACKSGILKNVEPALIISSNPQAGAIKKALALGINGEDILIIDPKSFKSRDECGEIMLTEFRKRNINFVGHYGFLRLTPEKVVKEYEGRIVNQHNGPLDTGRPDFGGPGMFGLRVHEARLNFVRKVNRDFWTEATTHYATLEFDKGTVVRRKKVEILPDDTAEILAARVLPVEHEVQIEALHDFSEGKVVEFHREIPLVRSGEEEILEECKEKAKKAYPNG